jgi:ubiquinone/menaquinone biosynthesis C-methylase UbiE
MKGHSQSKAPHGEATEGGEIHWAPAYEILFGWFLRRTHGTVVELAASNPGDRVLDVGCGTGSLAVALKASVGPSGSVHGVDASPEMIAVAKRKALNVGVDVDFQVGLAEAIPFPEETFDLVVSQLAIHHLPGDLKQRAFEEMYRVSKPDGRCLIVDFEPPKTVLGRSVARVLLGPTMMQTDVRNYRAVMAGAGFKNVETGMTRHRMLAFVRGRAARR